MQKYVINVTQADIDCGERKTWCMCPIALAAKRVLSGEIWIDTDYIIQYHGWHRNKSDFYGLPEVAQEFIKNFDSGYTVSPFSFEVSLDVD